MLKKLFFIAILGGLSTSAHALMFKTVQMSTTGALQNGVTGYYIHNDSGTIDNLSCVTMKSSGAWTLNGTTTTRTNTVTNGTETDNSTKTYTGAQTFNGSASFSSATVAGVTDGSNALAGKVGEYKSTATASAGGNVPGSATYFDVISLTLTAGDWDLTGLCQITASGATFTTIDWECFMTSNSGNTSTGQTSADNSLIFIDSTILGTGGYFGFSVPNYRVSITGSTTYYLKSYVASYSAGTPKIAGRMSARRVH